MANARQARYLLDSAKAFLEKYVSIFKYGDLDTLIGVALEEPNLSNLVQFDQDFSQYCDLKKYQGDSDEEKKARRDAFTCFFTPEEKDMFFDQDVQDMIALICYSLKAVVAKTSFYLEKDPCNFDEAQIDLSGCYEVTKEKLDKFLEKYPKVNLQKKGFNKYKASGKNFIKNQGKVSGFVAKAKKCRKNKIQ